MSYRIVSWWNIYTQRFSRYRADKQTDAGENPTPTIAVGVRYKQHEQTLRTSRKFRRKTIAAVLRKTCNAHIAVYRCLYLTRLEPAPLRRGAKLGAIGSIDLSRPWTWQTIVMNGRTR